MTAGRIIMGPVRSLLITALLILSGVVHAEDNRGIHVSGRGTIEVAPDMGHVQLHVRREGTNAATLKQELDKVVRAVLTLTGKLGIEERDVTATAVSVNPRYIRRDNASVVEGLIATRAVTVLLRDLDDFGLLLKESLEAGVNNLDPIRLDSSDRAELEDDALKLAMEDAQQEAARVAVGFSVELGPVTDVHVGGHAARPMEFARAAVMSDTGGGDFSPGVIRIERSVQATFSIIPGHD